MTTNKVTIGVLTVASAMWLGACVGSGDGSGAGRVLLSDGTASGDLVEAQMLNSDLICGCIGERALDQWCFDLMWPVGRATCLRAATRAHESTNVDSIDCQIVAYDDYNACLQMAGCSGKTDGACEDQFAATQSACAQLTEEAAADMRLCFPEVDDWSDNP